MERVRGVGPLSSAWKAEVIPVYDTRVAIFYQIYLLSSKCHMAIAP